MPQFDGELDTAVRTRRLVEVLEQLSTKCRAVILLQCRDGLSYQQIVITTLFQVTPVSEWNFLLIRRRTMKAAVLPVLAALSTLAWSCTHAAEPTDAAANYYGNSEVFRDHSGKIVEIINFRPDHTMRLWRHAENDSNATWREGKWVINSGQDSTILCNGPDEPSAKMYCHDFAPNKNIGDHWISIDRNGHAERPGGIPVVQTDGKWAMKDAAATPVPADVLIISLEKGMVEPPASR